MEADQLGRLQDVATKFWIWNLEFGLRPQAALIP
jgi:hypothetical protein